MKSRVIFFVGSLIVIIGIVGVVICKLVIRREDD